MKKMGKRIITGLLAITIIMAMTGCNGKQPGTEVEAKTVTEQQMEPEEDLIQLSIKEESFNTAFMLEIGESRKLEIDTDYVGLLKFESGNEEIATIDQDGTVTAFRNGTVMITVIAGDVKDTVNVVVKAPKVDVAETTEEEETPEIGSETGKEDTVNTNQDVASSGAANTSNAAGTSNNQASAAQPGSQATGTQPAGSQPTVSESTSAPATTYDPTNYYLDWDYIASQVNARLKANYPNATIGSGCWFEGAYYESGWFQMTEMDGYAGSRWTNESTINDIYSSIKHDLDAQNTSSETGKGMGMFVNSIVVNADGSRTITYTCYR